MMEPDDVLARLDACRRDDLSADDLARLAKHPQLARDFERIQSIDRQIAEALDETPVPAGLTGRILERLALAQRERVAVEHVSAASAIAGDAIAEARLAQPPIIKFSRQLRSQRLGRRAVLATALGGVAIVALALYLRPSETKFTSGSIADSARELFAAGQQEGQLVDQFPPPKPFPISSIVQRLPGARWNHLKGFVGRQGVVYHLQRGKLRASLYVVKMAGNPRAPEIVADSLPADPRPTSTGGLTSAVWREQGLVYVLVVEGSENEYQQFIAGAPVVA